ncbi:MAG: D-aminoacyl-tRNA deacylase [Thermodesulfobacteriaceae bacterium]|nr:D-aminoacyl-tRNA deacylase [Thermodesulfobacteriaceae bacterium]MCX8041031.1 D-aminoacyl-tRNA deacylase [Thermodesulfobacteriaceae bacterium]MDW8135270.1 D-aminoacyl-tRNA deacylase [Thermodesulfobacterium sp.]
MKLVIQRVSEAKVLIDGQSFSQIGKGLLVLACVEKEDNERVLDWVAEKLINLRIFPDGEGKFNLSLKEIGGEILLISNFTVCGFLKKGSRPSFHLAEVPEKAQLLLKSLKEKIENRGISVKEGVFGAYMKISLINDGPVTLFLEYPLKK